MDREYLVELINYDYKNEWLEFKKNWIAIDELGEYISALSNSAAEHDKENAYLIFGVDDKNHEIIGTNFEPDIDVNNEPLKHYLARNLNPSISFVFEEIFIDKKRLVVLTIPSAKRVVTEYHKERFIRIGSSKELLRKYPEREGNLWVKLRLGYPTIINTLAPNQNLDFTQLLLYYSAKGLPLKESTFKEDLCLYVPGTKNYNILAYLLSGSNTITCRVSVFLGTNKASSLYSINDFGHQCILHTVDEILRYGKTININRTDETNRVVERIDKPLFDLDSYREAILNAFIHNDWVDLNAPMIWVFSNRIEIVSNGALPKAQTLQGFYMGRSKPRCNELSEVFLQLRLSERSGRGVAKIMDKYGKEAFKIMEDSISVTIPFSGVGSEVRETKLPYKAENKMQRIKQEMKANPDITTMELMDKIGLKKTASQSYIKSLQERGEVKRIGARNSGYWKVLD
ncbi:MAG: putative DNA binding domain-containing protein [Sphaerochaetaceae bacterium]|nr:putative DNA binding domain-containing protein [Sphaerochaetaceae bacterium]